MPRGIGDFTSRVHYQNLGDSQGPARPQEDKPDQLGETQTRPFGLSAKRFRSSHQLFRVDIRRRREAEERQRILVLNLVFEVMLRDHSRGQVALCASMPQDTEPGRANFFEKRQRRASRNFTMMTPRLSSRYAHLYAEQSFPRIIECG